MRIRVKLLLLIGLMGFALLVNLLSLGFLVGTVETSVATVEQVGIQQQLVAAQMEAQLRDAEAALYRYLIEGEAGFAAQFHEQLQNFNRNVAVYQTQATDTAGYQQAEVLQTTYQQAVAIGTELIELRDTQSRELQRLEAIQTQLAALLTGPIRQARPNDVAYQEVVSRLYDNLRGISLAVTSYMASPTEAETVRFTEAVVGFRQQLERYRALAETPQEADWADELARTFDEMETLGSRLISRRSQQQTQFANFAAMLFHAGQEVLEGQIQPQAAQNMAQIQQRLFSTLRFAVMVSLTTAVAASLLAVVVTLPMLGQMDTNISALLQGAERVATGRLDEPVEVSGQGELHRLAQAFNTMMAELAVREQRLRARRSELETLRQISLQLTSTLDPDRVLNSIATSARELVDAAEVHIFVTNGGSEPLIFAASAWRGKEQKPLRQPRPDGLVATAVKTGQPQVINYAENHPLFNTPEMAKWGVKAAAAFPLKLGEQNLGVFNVSFDDRPAFDESDLRILRLLTDQAAIALYNARLYQSLADREARLQTLAQKLAHIQEEERRLVGLDLHDGLTQLLLSTNMHLNTLAALTDGLNEPARTELTLARARLSEAIDEARRVIAELRPAVLEELGLVDGLRQYVAEIARQEQWEVDFVVEPAQIHLAPPVETAVFRITQEAVTNARKYAVTSRLRLQLYLRKNRLILSIQDWGRGFNPVDIVDESRRLGLAGMQERAALLGGECRIESQPGQGTHIWVEIPVS